MFDALAASVTDSQHRLLDHASHSWMHIEAEDTIVQAIRGMVDKAQR